MTYERESAQAVYRSKGGAKVKVFDALESMAAMSSHIPNALVQRRCEAPSVATTCCADGAIVTVLPA